MLDSVLSFLVEGESSAIALGKGQDGLLVSADDESVREAGREGVTSGILDVDDLVGAGVVLNGEHSANTTDVVSASDEDSAEVFEFNDAFDLAGEQVKLKEAIKYNCFSHRIGRESTLTLTVSFFLMSGWGKRMVLPSWVTM